MHVCVCVYVCVCLGCCISFSLISQSEIHTALYTFCMCVHVFVSVCVCVQVAVSAAGLFSVLLQCDIWSGDVLSAYSGRSGVHTRDAVQARLGRIHEGAGGVGHWYANTFIILA